MVTRRIPFRRIPPVAEHRTSTNPAGGEAAAAPARPSGDPGVSPCASIVVSASSVLEAENGNLDDP
jgi:hypothetical protein